MESLERFVQREPFYRVRECDFAVLAIESETIDPRFKKVSDLNFYKTQLLQWK